MQKPFSAFTVLNGGLGLTVSAPKQEPTTGNAPGDTGVVMTVVPAVSESRLEALASQVLS
jgi:hypothetical protein